MVRTSRANIPELKLEYRARKHEMEGKDGVQI
jgi:hypothetical protein